ncbi:MAG: ABC transporter substrate-binding protein [Acidimicrobiia bacterium]
MVSVLWRARTQATPSRRARRGWVVVLVALGLVAAACGGDDGGDAPAARASDDAAASGAPSGEPIKVMTSAPVNTQLPPYPNIPEAAKIYAEYINDKGGINGRPLEVITCDDRGEANEAANCARQAVEEKVVANVGSFTFDVSRGIDILREANIAWFGACCPIVQQEFSYENSFVLGANFAASTGAAVRMIEDGCKAPAAVVVELATTDLARAQIENGYRSAGFDPAKAKFVTLPLTAQDYTSQVAQATDGTDCIYGGISDSNWLAFLPAMEATGAKQRLYGLQGNLNGKVAEQFPELTENGVVVNSYTDIVSDVWTDYRDALERYDAPDLDWNSLAGLGTWTAFTAFTQIVESMEGDITAETFLEAASNTTAVDTGGMINVIDLTKPYEGAAGSGEAGSFPRIFNRSVAYDVIHDGKLTPIDDKFYDMTNALEGKPS